MPEPRPRPALRAVTRTPLEPASAAPAGRFDKNENLAPDPRVAAALRRAITPELLSRYPDYPAFYAKLGRWLGCRPENLLITPGSDGAIKLAFESYLGPGGRFVVMSPSFAMFEVYGKAFGGRPVRVDFNADLSFPTDRLLKAVRPGVKLVAVASPNNPTGSVLAEADFLRLARRCERAGALLVMDEAYYFFSRRTAFRHVLKFRNVLLTRTFSKACGLAALRIGFAYGPRRLIETLRKTQPIFDVNAAALKAAEAVMAHDGWIWRYARSVADGRRELARAAERLGLRALPGEGNFMLLDLGRPAGPVAARLRRRGVVVGAGYRFAPLRRCLKVTLGPPAVMRRFARALGAAL